MESKFAFEKRPKVIFSTLIHFAISKKDIFEESDKTIFHKKLKIYTRFNLIKRFLDLRKIVIDSFDPYLLEIEKEFFW